MDDSRNRIDRSREVGAESPEPEPTDESLLALTAKGDMGSFEILVGRYQKGLLNFIFHYLRNREDSEDLLQRVFIKVHQNAGRFTGNTGFRQWIYRIAFNEAMDHFRTLKRENAILPRKGVGDHDRPVAVDRIPAGLGSCPEAVVEQRMRNEAINGLLDSLDQKYRDPLVLRHLHHLSYDEIAVVLDLPAGTVKTNIHRGRLALRGLIETRGAKFI